MATAKGKPATGAKKTTAGKTTGAKKTTSRARKPVKKQSTIPWPAIGMLLIAVGIVFIVCLVTTNNAPAFVVVRGFVNGTFGLMGFIASLLLIMLGLQTAFGDRWPLRKLVWVQFALLAFCVATLLQSFQVESLLHMLRSQGYVQNYNGFLWKSYDISYSAPVGGGSMGALLAYPMVRYLDVLGSALILFFAIFAIVLWIVHTLAPSTGERLMDAFARFREDLAVRHEERMTEKEAQRQEQEAYEASLAENAANEALLVPLPTDLMEADVDEAPARQTPKGRRVQPKTPPKPARQTPAPRQQVPEQTELEWPQEDAPAWTPAWDAPAQPAPQAPPAEEKPVQRPRTRLYIEHNVPTRSNPAQEAYTEEDAERFKYATRPSRKDETAIPEFILKRREQMDAEYGHGGLFMERDEPAPPQPAEEARAPKMQRDEPPLAGGLQIEAIGGPVEEPGFDDVPWEEPVLPFEAAFMPAGMEAQEEPVPIFERPAFDTPPPVPQPPKPRQQYVVQNPLDKQPKLDPETRLDRPDWKLPEPEEEAAEPESEPYRQPPFSLLERDDSSMRTDTRAADAEGARKLEETLKSFGVGARVIKVVHGPAITRYELQPAPGVKVSKIVGLTDDIALNMAAVGVRIEAPIPGKAAIGIEIANDEIQTVHLRDVLESDESLRNQSKLAVALGKDIAGKRIIADLAKMPHLLIAGATGSGKSVCINTLIASIIYRATPEEVRLILIDPKKVELAVYNGIPHLLVPVVTDPKKASGALAWAVMEMDERYKVFAEVGVRDIKGYNAQRDADTPLMPQIVVIIDELSDLMLVAPGEVEESICRIAQLARACGIHLVIATQRPSVNVITGIIKANVPSRIAFAVSSQVDSRTILDGAGAEKLLGRGDMLYAPSGGGKPLRVQGCFVSDDEVKRVVDYVKNWHTTDYSEAVIEALDAVEDNTPHVGGGGDDDDSATDALFDEAVDMAIESGQMSISMLQRRLRVGYARAGRIVDEMTQHGIIGQADGAKPREVLISREEYQIMKGR